MKVPKHIIYQMKLQLAAKKIKLVKLQNQIKELEKSLKLMIPMKIGE